MSDSQFAAGESFAYRTPTDLKVTETPIKRVLVVGSCGVAGFPEYVPVAHRGAAADYVINNNGSDLPSDPPAPISSYDFQLVQIALRSILPDATLFRMPPDTDGCRRVFNETIGRLRFCLQQEMKWNREHGILTFVMGFLKPQQNPMGRLLPRDDIRNLVYFVEQVNVELRKLVAAYSNAYVVEMDDVVSSIGRRHFQDDVLWPTNHGAALGDNDVPADPNRLVKPTPPSELFALQTYEGMRAIWAEVEAMYRTARQVDAVKMVIMDLDDTLWRGVAAENQDVVPHMEGWPLGVAETLLWLRKRGVVLAIASKNDASTVERLWERMYWGSLTLDDFPIRRINWDSKILNIEQIMKTASLLPRNVVFIDDNPAEREAVKAAFPEIRVLGAELYTVRRALLWSAETQVPAVTMESAKRNEMMQAQVQREEARAVMSPEEFIKSLNVVIDTHVIGDTKDPQFARAFELINKTNQYNTTGRR